MTDFEWPPELGQMPEEVAEYLAVRDNDLDEDPAFEQGRSYVRDLADAALEAVGKMAKFWKLNSDAWHRAYEVQVSLREHEQAQLAAMTAERDRLRDELDMRTRGLKSKTTTVGHLWRNVR